MGAPWRRLVRLSDVATVATTTGPAAIERMNRQQIILNANVAGRSLGDVVRRSSPSWQTTAARRLQLRLRRPSPANAETFSNMGLALAVAVLFIFFVLASQFESVLHPSPSCSRCRSP